MSIIFATNFTDFYDKLLKNLYDCNCTLNLVKKNDVKLLRKYGNFTGSEFYGISASLVLASTTINQFIYFYYIALPYIGFVVLNF